MSLEYVIDGYNVIHHRNFPKTSEGLLNPALGLLTAIRSGRLTGSTRNKTIIVFDGYPPAHHAAYVDADIRVEYSRDSTADDRIKQIVEEAHNPKNMVVVSNDREIRFFVKSTGAKVFSVEEFLAPYFSRQVKAAHSGELTLTQKHKINQELKKIWLK